MKINVHNAHIFIPIQKIIFSTSFQTNLLPLPTRLVLSGGFLLLEIFPEVSAFLSAQTIADLVDNSVELSVGGCRKEKSNVSWNKKHNNINFIIS